MRRNTFLGAAMGIVVGSFLLVGQISAQEKDAEIEIKTRQPAIFAFRNGAKGSGILISLDSKNVTYAIMQVATVSADTFCGIQTKDDLYVYNFEKKRFYSGKKNLIDKPVAGDLALTGGGGNLDVTALVINSFGMKVKTAEGREVVVPPDKIAGFKSAEGRYAWNTSSFYVIYETNEEFAARMKRLEKQTRDDLVEVVGLAVALAKKAGEAVKGDGGKPEAKAPQAKAVQGFVQYRDGRSAKDVKIELHPASVLDAPEVLRTDDNGYFEAQGLEIVSKITVTPRGQKSREITLRKSHHFKDGALKLTIDRK